MASNAQGWPAPRTVQLFSRRRPLIVIILSALGASSRWPKEPLLTQRRHQLSTTPRRIPIALPTHTTWTRTLHFFLLTYYLAHHK